jgi:hypothetical protein
MPSGELNASTWQKKGFSQTAVERLNVFVTEKSHVCGKHKEVRSGGTILDTLALRD